jgi:hypothetical protein
MQSRWATRDNTFEIVARYGPAKHMGIRSYGAGKWKWVKTSPDGARSESEEFANLAACTSNAAEHGYIPWKSEDEQRRDLQLGVTAALKRKE